MGMLWISPHFYVYPIKWCLDSDFFLWKDLFCKTSLKAAHSTENFCGCGRVQQMSHIFTLFSDNEVKDR